MYYDYTRYTYGEREISGGYVTVKIDGDVAEAARREAEKEGVSLEEFIADCLNQLLESLTKEAEKDT
ncbi:TPA: hypothetical protein EYP75_03120 [Candidatus Bathyarchaeota archaeon]|nr:hypothetical protein [Candidatus Bathyarchaeota archaeon]